MRRTLLTSVLVVLLAATGMARPVAAHDGDGRIEVVAAEPRDDGSIVYRLRVVFVADGHGAPEATVTATVVDPADPQAPQPLTKTAEDGIYEGEVRFPRAGSWTVRFTSLRPTASLERPEEIVAPTTTSATATTSTSGVASTDDDTLPATGTTEPTSDSSPAPLIAVVVALALVALVVVQARRRRRPT